MKAKELINNNSLTNIEVTGKETVVFTEIAITAINIAREEEKQKWEKACAAFVKDAEDKMKEKAVRAFRRFVEDYCIESGRTNISDDSEHYIKVFNELINV